MLKFVNFMAKNDSLCRNTSQMTPYIYIIVRKMQMRFFSLLSNLIHCVFVKRMHFKYIVHCLSILAIERASVMNNRLHFGSFTVLFTTAISAVAYVFKSLIHRRALLHIHMYPSTVSFELYVIRVWCVLLESELYTMKIINKAIVCCTGIKHSVLVVRISRAKNVDLNRCAL